MSVIYAVAVVLEADSAEEAFDRVSDEVAPEPGNAHFVGTPVAIDKADEYDTRSVAEAMAAGADTASMVEAVSLQCAFLERGDKVRRELGVDVVVSTVSGIRRQGNTISVYWSEGGASHCSPDHRFTVLREATV